jgi:hypothetical protein
MGFYDTSTTVFQVKQQRATPNDRKSQKVVERNNLVCGTDKNETKKLTVNYPFFALQEPIFASKFIPRLITVYKCSSL